MENESSFNANWKHAQWLFPNNNKKQTTTGKQENGRAKWQNESDKNECETKAKLKRSTFDTEIYNSHR